MSDRASVVRFFRGSCRLFAAFLLGSALASSPASGAGVTIITHGLNGNVDGWITSMASAITNFSRFSPTNFTVYQMNFVPNGGGYLLTANRVSGEPPPATDAAEIVIKLDWRQLADGNSYNTFQVASFVVPALLSTNFISELGGRAIAALPLHLIGHSRGGSLACEMSWQLGTNGVWVDHVTTLDAHPLNDDGFPFDPLLGLDDVDALARTYESVLFADSYWQDLDFLVYGKAASGAYTRKLLNLNGGYSGTADEHSDVHLWYHGTINTNTPASYVEDGNTITITGTVRTNWWSNYEVRGMKAGFLYSLLRGGDRLTLDEPVGQNAIVDGYNQRWDLGAGTANNNRTALPANNGQWASLIRFNRVTTNDVPLGQSTSATFYYQWAAAVTNLATVSIYLDNDFNPFNGNGSLLKQSVVPASGSGSVGLQTLSLDLAATNAAPGVHALFATITGGGRTRYLYAPEILRVTASGQAPVLDVTPLLSGQLNIGINGVIGQTIVLQSSVDLLNWLPIITNTLTAARWDYTNNASADQQYFRAVVGQ